MDAGLSYAAQSAPPSLGERLDARNGIGPGFDHLRIGLALAILLWHSFGLSYGSGWTETDPLVLQFRPLLCSLLAMFFALSGFLVIGSAIRLNDLRTFITFRVLRILPALATEISLSALVLGPALTVLPLRDYVADPHFISYFGSLIGWVRFVLPGLFVTNPVPDVVNGALWTVGPEIFCYVMLSLLILTTIFRRPAWMLAFSLVYLAACLVSDVGVPPVITEVLPTKSLVWGFLAGNLVFHYRYRLPFLGRLAMLAGAGAMTLLAVAQAGGAYAVLVYPAVALLAYVTAFIGLADLPPLPFFHRGDYSYGIYIFGFPMQQMIAHFLPAHRVWWVNFGLALPLTLVFAVLSWHLIEKPVLGMRKRFLAGDTRRPPAPPSRWQRRDLALAAILACYGLFVATVADVFPIWRVAHHVYVATRPARPPQGIR